MLSVFMLVITALNYLIHQLVQQFLLIIIDQRVRLICLIIMGNCCLPLLRLCKGKQCTEGSLDQGQKYLDLKLHTITFHLAFFR